MKTGIELPKATCGGCSAALTVIGSPNEKGQIVLKVGGCNCGTTKPCVVEFPEALGDPTEDEVSIIKRFSVQGTVYHIEFADGIGNGAYLKTHDDRWFFLIDGLGEIERVEDDIEAKLKEETT